ncbi:MAG TPA: hypothetical protein VGP72_17640 [Planctomycetota bacterium]|jgi:hypothetical protein
MAATETAEKPQAQEEQAGIGSRIERLQHELGTAATNIYSGALEALNAQVSIALMKVTRAAVLAGVGLVGLLALAALAVYGFILLDAVIAYAIDLSGLPWLSPLIRGFLYFGIPMITVFVVWHTQIGYGGADEPSQAHSSAEKEAGGGI